MRTGVRLTRFAPVGRSAEGVLGMAVFGGVGLAAQLQIRTAGTCRGCRRRPTAQRSRAACDGAWTSPGRGPRASGSMIRQGPDTAGHGELAPADGAVSIRASVSINVVRLTPKLRHTAAFDMPSSSAARMASSFSPTITGARPPTHPAATPSRCQPGSLFPAN